MLPFWPLRTSIRFLQSNKKVGSCVPLGYTLACGRLSGPRPGPLASGRLLGLGRSGPASGRGSGRRTFPDNRRDAPTISRQATKLWPKRQHRLSLLYYFSCPLFLNTRWTAISKPYDTVPLPGRKRPRAAGRQLYYIGPLSPVKDKFYPF